MRSTSRWREANRKEQAGRTIMNDVTKLGSGLIKSTRRELQ